MNQKFNRQTLITAIVLICVVSVGFWISGLFYVSTDDAYVGANVIQIAPRVTGQVIALNVKNNQEVHKGQVLMTLDPALFLVAMNQAKADLENAKAKLMLAQNTEQRTAALLKRNVASHQDDDTATANLRSANAAVQLAEANLAQAELNLQYTQITAPNDGWVANVTVRTGDSINANQPVFALVENREFWVDANFKETEFSHLHSGQSADVVIDMYPGHHFKGTVESISSGSGSAFALLPPENATGNWVKVTQRVPVRIHIADPDPKYPLRIGTSATVTVHFTPWSS